MDMEITQTKTCDCGRGIVSVTGVCGECIHEGAVAFWASMGMEIPVKHRVKAEKAVMTAFKRDHGFEDITAK
jgi:hypothetical protein